MNVKEDHTLGYINQVLQEMPTDWLKLTTHRLDIYDESKAKSQFLDQFNALFHSGHADQAALEALPTAYDYIRLGHPLSSVLEWTLAKMNQLQPEAVISFSSRTAPILAVLRKNLMDNKATRIRYAGSLLTGFDAEIVRKVYGYNFELQAIDSDEAKSPFEGSTIDLVQEDALGDFKLSEGTDFLIHIHPQLGSVILVNGEHNHDYIAAIQHVRRRETIAMTPANCHIALQLILGQPASDVKEEEVQADKSRVLESIKSITHTSTTPVVGSSGLSVQYAIMMGLVHEAKEQHPGKDVRFIVPPNCYGGTNDQARRVAACLDHVEILDLPVDGDNNMVQSTDRVLHEVAQADAVPYIIAEIPTNPRVEVPDLQALHAALSKPRTTASGEKAIDPVFILDQTFCPNVNFLGEGQILSDVRAIAYVSGSKFPSGGKCTAGYCVANQQAAALMPNIARHMVLCDNEATPLQYAYLAEQLPSMNQRIADAYANTRAFVNFIRQQLPAAKINFVSEELAKKGFTPSVFSLDLPTKGDTDEERETYKRSLNLKLINKMITQIPDESKYCVSYGQLKGCYWTIPATSTQGTTKEGDKDYIARVALSGNMNLEKHKEVFREFVEEIS